MIMARFLPAATFRVILVSRPGYLRTPLAGRESLDAQADLLAAVLDSLDIARVGLLTWSGSGPCGYRLAVRHPDRISALVAVAAVSVAMEVPPPDFASRLLLGTPAGAMLLRFLVRCAPRSLIRSALSSEGELSPSELASQVAHVVGDAEQRRFVLDLGATTSMWGSRLPGFRNDCDQIHALGSLGLEGLAAPCLLIHGGLDTDVPLAHSEAALRVLPCASLLPIHQGTHLAFYAGGTWTDGAQRAARRFLEQNATTASVDRPASQSSDRAEAQFEHHAVDGSPRAGCDETENQVQTR
jgi:pimeloyl-ACP methyl ester carboxylesterase